MKHLICFGDSITRGENDQEYGGWVDRLKTYCIKEFLKSKKDEICTFNMGIGGEDTDGLVKRFKEEFDIRLLENRQNIVSFGYGANDIAIVNKENKVPIERYYSNLAYCIDYALKKKSKVYIINILPIQEVENRHQSVQRKERRMSDIKKYNQALNLISKEKKVEIIDVHSVFTSDTEELFTFDGVHPNSEGHKLMSKIIRDALFN